MMDWIGPFFAGLGLGIAIGHYFGVNPARLDGFIAWMRSLKGPPK